MRGNRLSLVLCGGLWGLPVTAFAQTTLEDLKKEAVSEADRQAALTRQILEVYE